MKIPISYLAGLLDGEGYFGANPYRLRTRKDDGKRVFYPSIQLSMCDEDVVRTFAEETGINKYRTESRQYKNPHHRDIFCCTRQGELAAEIMTSVWPYLGSEKRDQVNSVFHKCDIPLLPPDLIFPRDDAYAAGIIEGEGCFLINNAGCGHLRPGVEFVMSCFDIVRSVADILGIESIQTILPKNGKKTVLYRGRMNGQRAIDVMKRILPYMGERRSEKINSLLFQFADWTPRRILSDDSVMEIFGRVWNRESATVLAKEFGITASSVGDIKYGRTHSKLTDSIMAPTLL